MKKEKCSHCSAVLGKQKRYHIDRCYCPSCYSLFFKLRRCVKCGKVKRISKDDIEPICKECLYKNKPCAECGKLCKEVTQLTKKGAICTSCIKKKNRKNKPQYKACEWCLSTKYPSSMRHVGDGNKKAYICSVCYTKTLPICSLCGYRRHPFIYSFKQKPICKICAIEDKRQCLNCGHDFQAGIGNYCLNCSHTKTFKKRVTLFRKYFNSEFSVLFEQFAYWLKERRGVQFTSVHLLNYVEYFQSIQRLSIELNAMPSYKEVVKRLTVATTRKFLSVTLFFDSIKIIKIDRKIQEEYSNLDMIERYLEFFDTSTSYHKYLIHYHNYLKVKLAKKKITLRSVRLALSPAVNFLKLCQYSCIYIPNNDLLYGYLWATTGQASALTGFITFLNKFYHLDLISPLKVDLSLSRVTKGKKQLKQMVIQLLRETELNDKQKQRLFSASIGYFHGIALPNYMRVTKKMVSLANSKGGDFKMCHIKFYLPEEIIFKLM